MKAHIEALVLCAGRGTRLGPLTAETPKAMLPIAGRPALEWILDWLAKYDIHNVAVNLGTNGDVIARHFGPRLHYNWESSLLGTGGALAPFKDYLTDPCILVFGDVLTTCDVNLLVDTHREYDTEGPHVTIAIHTVSDPQDKGVVVLAQDYTCVATIREKPLAPAGNSVFAGIAILDSAVFQRAFEGDDFVGDILRCWLAAGRVVIAHQIVEAYLIDFGTPETYEQACREWPGIIGAEQ